MGTVGMACPNNGGEEPGRAMMQTDVRREDEI